MSYDKQEIPIHDGDSPRSSGLFIVHHFSQHGLLNNYKTLDVDYIPLNNLFTIFLLINALGAMQNR